MDKSQEKTGSPILFFVAALAIIATVTLVANLRSPVAEELHFRLNNGVANLSTCDDRLMAVCNDSKIYLWDWWSLSKSPQAAQADCDQAVLLAGDVLLSVARGNPKAVVLTGLDDSKKHREIDLRPGNSRAVLAVSRNRNLAAIVLSRTDPTEPPTQLYEVLGVDAEGQTTDTIVSIDAPQRSRVKKATMSDDGAFIAMAGYHDKHGWLVVIDYRQGRLVWNKELSDMPEMQSCAFSVDGRILYARGSDSTLLKIDTESGQILARLLPVKENRSTLRVQAVQTTTTSPDGRFVAATIGNCVYVWDCRNDKLVCSGGSGHKVISGIAFSPDSRYIATSDMRQGGTIKIWRVPKK